MDRYHSIRSFTIALGVLSWLLAAGCGRQRPPAAGSLSPGIDPAALQIPPVYSLLGFRDQLELTSEQVERLDSIGQWLDAHRGDGLLGIDAPPPAGRQSAVRLRGGSARLSPEVSAELESLARTNLEAVARVEATLSESQRQRVCELVRAEPAATRGSAGSSGRQLYGPGGGAPVGRGRYIWPWCAPPEGLGQAAPPAS